MNPKNISKRVKEGIARNVNGERVVQSNNNISDRTDILYFTIEQTDHQGNPIRYIPVYCEAKQIKGILVDGDPVRVSGQISEGGTLLPEEIFNIRTQASVEFKTKEQLTREFLRRCLQFIVYAVLLFILFVILGVIIRMFRSGNFLEILLI